MEAAPGIPHVAAPKPTHRSRVTNGSKLLPLSDQRSVTCRRYRDLYQSVCNDLGGADHLSTAQLQLARRASMLSAESERMEALACRGDADFNIADYGLNVSLLCRVFNILGVHRVAKTLPSLHEYLAKPGKQPVEIDDEGDTS
jgi:hypothetical protein